MPNHIQNRLQIIGSRQEINSVLSHISGTWDDGTKRQIDFNKIVPMPTGLEIEIHSGIEMWVKICTGQLNFKAFLESAKKGSSFGNVWIDKGFDSMINYMATSTAFEALLGERNIKNVKDFDESDFEMFIQALKNYRQHGYIYWHDWSPKHWGTKWNAYNQNDSKNTEGTIYFQTAWNAPVPVICTLSTLFPSLNMVLSFADEDTGSNTGRIVFNNGEEIESLRPVNQSKEAYELYFELHPADRKQYKLVGDNYEYIDEEE